MTSGMANEAQTENNSEANLSLSELIEQHLLSSELRLPVFSQVAQKVQAMAESAEVDINSIEKVILQDQALAMRVLRYANSSFYAGLEPVKTVKNATVRLGTNQLVQLVVLGSSKENYRTKNITLQNYMDMLWKHSIACALGSQWLARKLGHMDLMQEAFMSGLFHDVGKLFVMKMLDDIYELHMHQISLTESIVLEVAHSMHAEKGEFLMKEWHLPEEYCEIVRSHHSEEYDTDNVTLSIVRLVDKICNGNGIGLSLTEDVSIPDLPEIQLLKIPENVVEELEVAIEEALGIA